MNLREKYGEWGLILGATEGVGKAFCEKIAAGGMNVVMVGRREEKLNVLAGEIRETYGVETKVVRADFSQPGAAETVFAATEGLDMGFMSYVACLHSFGKIQDTPWEKHEAMINVNVVTFLKCFHHYMRIFATQDRGAVINVSSMTGISSSPWNGQYGAGKAFILKMTEAVACECEGTGVDVEVITQNVDDLHERAGSTRVTHLHGELRKLRSSRDPALIVPIEGWEQPLDATAPDGALLPHIVFFGEAVPQFDHAARIAAAADVLIVVGTSLAVYPAASLVHYVRPGVPIYLVDPGAPDVRTIRNPLTHLRERAAVGMPELAERLRRESQPE